MSYRSLLHIFAVLLICLPLGKKVNGQTTIVIERIPENTPVGQGIFISGDFEGWTGGQDRYRLKEVSDQYMIDFPKSEKKISFKFTRGHWDYVETDTNGRQLDNRELTLTGTNDTVRYEILQWADLVPKVSTASKNVHLLDAEFDMYPLKNKRRIWIYLPETYHHSTKHYPVLYMHDGQNLFDQSLSYSGEWQVDETLDNLAKLEVLELIVVGIDNGGAERIDEYTPWEITDFKSKELGDAYVRFIKDNLKPYIDTAYRTRSDRDQTGIMGSSLGGLISFYAGLQYPETFGKVGVFSPSFSLVEASSDFTKKHGLVKDSKFYFMAGDSESERMVGDMQMTIGLMTGSGFPKNNLTSKVVENGEHNEKLWRQQFGQAIQWLFNN